jgi:hypothetical protein
MESGVVGVDEPRTGVTRCCRDQGDVPAAAVSIVHPVAPPVLHDG